MHDRFSFLLFFSLSHARILFFFFFSLLFSSHLFSFFLCFLFLIFASFSFSFFSLSYPFLSLFPFFSTELFLGVIPRKETSSQFLFLSHDMCLHMIHFPCTICHMDTCTRWKMSHHMVMPYGTTPHVIQHPCLEIREISTVS